jgi:hypothetical protein
VSENQFPAITSIFDSVVMPWVLVGMMFLATGIAAYWIAMPS